MTRRKHGFFNSSYQKTLMNHPYFNTQLLRKISAQKPETN